MLRRGGEGYLEGVCEKGNEQREGADEASAARLGLHGGAMQAIAGGAAAVGGAGGDRECFLAGGI